MSILLKAIPQKFIIRSIHYTLEMSSQSLLVRRSAMLWRSTDKEIVTLGFLFLPTGIKAWPLVKGHSPYSCSQWFWMVSSPLHLAPAVVRSTPRYDHTVCVHGCTSYCVFNFWSYMSLKCIKDWPSFPHHQQSILPPNFYVGIWQQVLYEVAPFALFCDSGSHVVETCYHLLITAHNCYTGNFSFHLSYHMWQKNNKFIL